MLSRDIYKIMTAYSGQLNVGDKEEFNVKDDIQISRLRNWINDGAILLRKSNRRGTDFKGKIMN